jgi:DNA-binding CsgD family transcriptional regulator
MVFDFLESLAAAETVETAREAMIRFFEAHEHPCISYVLDGQAQNGGKPLPPTFSTGSVRQVQQNRSARAAHGQHDQVFVHASRSPRPFYWAQAPRDSDPSIGPVCVGNTLVVDCPWAREAGQASCLVVPLRHGDARLPGLVGIFSELTQPNLERSLETRGSALCLAALAADQRMQAIQRAQVARHISLSPREQECLKWLGSGLRNDRIAERMGVTRPTVEMHLANARRKLGAATRDHALVKALSFGLIDV